MRHALVVFGVALVLAVGIVLLVAGGEEDVVVEDPSETSTAPVTTTPSATTPTNDDQRRDDERAAIELALARYIAAAERGEVDAPVGLPTSDELSIAAINSARRTAQVRLAGGAKVDLRKAGGRWRVVRARPAPIPAPTPPSNG